MPVDRSTLSPAEITEGFLYARDSHILGNGEVQLLEDFDTPALNMLLKNMDSSSPERGEYKIPVTDNRKGAMTAYSGRDIRPFTSFQTTFDLTYPTGQVSLDEEITLQELEEAGIKIDHGSDMTSTGRTYTTASKDARMVVANFAKTKIMLFEKNYNNELNKYFWFDNASNAKLWPGIAANVSETSVLLGNVGDQPRSNAILRHQLRSGVTIDTIEKTITEMVIRLVDVGAKKLVSFCGNNVYSMMSDLYLGTSTRAGKIDRVLSSEKAAKMGEKWGIGLGDDAFSIPGVGVIARETSFSTLDSAGTFSVPWANRLYVLDMSVLKARGPRHAIMVPHPIPHNQDVLRYSLKGKYTITNSAPNHHGVITI